MNQEKESERFRRLANEDLELVYQAIETSEEPWWGFGILANREFFKVRDEQRIRNLIDLRKDHILVSLKNSSSPADITWSMHRYLWFFEREETLDALAEAMRNTDISWQLFDDFKHHRVLMENQNLQSAFIHALEHSLSPHFVVSVLRDYPIFLSEEGTVDAILRAIDTTDNIFPLIAETALIRVIAENEMIQNAIQNRFPDIVDLIQPTTFNWMYIRDISHVKSIVGDERLAKRISTTLKEQDNSLLNIKAIFSFCEITELTRNETIQHAVAQVIEGTEDNDVCGVLEPVAKSRLLVESDPVKSAISKRISSIVSNILTAESPLKVVEAIGMIPVVTQNKSVRNAIRTRMPGIIQDVRKAVDNPIFTWTFYKSAYRIPEIFCNTQVRELIDPNIIMNDKYGLYSQNIAQYPSLAKDSLIWKAMHRAIKEFPDPAWFITSLADIPRMYDDLEIRKAIEERIPRIIELIEEDDEVELLCREIAGNSFLMSFKDIEDAINKKIHSKPTPWRLIAGLPYEYLQKEFICDIIKNGSESLSENIIDDYSQVFDYGVIRILRSEAVVQLEEVQEVLDSEFDRVLEDLESAWDVWYSILFLQNIPQYAFSEKVLKAIRNRIDDLVHALKTNNDWVQVLHALSPYSDLLLDERIIAAIAERIRASQEPYMILDVDGLNLLLQHESIKDALRDSIPDFVFGITSTSQAYFIVKEIEKVEFLREDSRVSRAIREFKDTIE